MATYTDSPTFTHIEINQYVACLPFYHLQYEYADIASTSFSGHYWIWILTLFAVYHIIVLQNFIRNPISLISRCKLQKDHPGPRISLLFPICVTNYSTVSFLSTFKAKVNVWDEHNSLELVTYMKPGVKSYGFKTNRPICIYMYIWILYIRTLLTLIWDKRVKCQHHGL